LRPGHPRRQRNSILAALVVAFPSIADETCAGGWPLAPGTGELIVPVTRMTADEHYDAAGNKQSKSRYTKIEIAPYGEYGLTSWMTLVGEAAWASDETDYFGMKFQERGMTRLKAGARFALGTWRDTHFSLQPLATLHLTRDTGDPAATKSGDIDAELALVLARNDTLLGMEAFSVQEIGYRRRDRNRPDEVRVDITLGVKPWPGTMLLIKSLNTAATKPTAAGQSYQSGKVALSVVYDLAPDLALEIGGERSIMGRNAIAEESFRLAVWYRF